MSLYTEHAFLNRPAFIVGYPKSGTTLLTAVLDGHRDLLVLPEELDLFGVILSSMESWRYKLTPAKIDFILNKIFTSTHMRRLATEGPREEVGGNYNYSRIDHQKMAAEITTFLKTEGLKKKHLLPAVVYGFQKVAQPRRKSFTRWIEKTPRQEHHVRQLEKWFPRAKFIHVVRDPRDNYISYKKKHPGLTPDNFSREWLESAERAIEHQDLIGRDNYKLMCYEDFVRNFEEKVLQIARFLEISDSPALREPSKFGVPWFGNSMFDGAGYNQGAISTQALERYKDYENQEAIKEVEKSTAEMWDILCGRHPVS